MATLDQKIHIKQGNTIQEVTLYTTTEEASVYGAYGTARYNNADCYYALGTGADTNTGSAYITPLRVIKNNIIYYMLTEGQNSEAAVVTKTRRYIGGYAENNVANYQTVTTLPQTSIEYLTDIEPLADASFVFNNCSSLTSLSGVEQTWDTSNVTDMHYMFYNCQALTSVDVSNWNTSKVKTINKMFQNCTALTSLDLSNFDTSNVTNMQSMFYNCNHLISLDLSNWDTSKVSSMSYMFYNCQALQYLVIDSSTFKFELLENTYLNNTCKILVPQALIPTYQAAANWSDHASQFDAIENYKIIRANGQVTVKPSIINLQNYAKNNIANRDITTLPQENIEELTNIVLMPDASHAFEVCSHLTSLSDVEKTWDTSNVTNMYYMFDYCYALTSLDVSNWDTSNVTNMQSMFEECGSLISLDASNWNTAKVTDMGFMFYECYALTSVDLSSWDTSSVTYMKNMFATCIRLTSLDISNWDTSNVTDMETMFASCSALTTLDVSNWDTSKVTASMGMMFSYCDALQYLIINSSTFKFEMKTSDCGLNATCKILVPQALIATYQAATNWSNYASQFDAIENYTITRSNGQVTVKER